MNRHPKKNHKGKIKPFTVKWLRSFKHLAKLPEEQAWNIINSIRQFAVIAYDTYTTQLNTESKTV